MKLKLITIVVLLAAGGLMLGYHHQSVSTPLFGPLTWQAPFGSRPSQADQTPFSIEVQRFFQHETTPDIRSLPKFESTPTFLKGISNSIRESEPFQLNLAVFMQWNGIEMALKGWYGQIGQRVNNSRLELFFGDPYQPINELDQAGDDLSIAKICDGRFLYTLIRNQGHDRVEFIDLRKIQETKERNEFNGKRNPINWIAMDGIASLIESLADAFEFSEPDLFEFNGRQRCRINGVWNEEGLRELLKEVVAEDRLTPEIVWHKLPPQLPHQICLEMVHYPTFGWIPVQLQYFQFERQKKSTQQREPYYRLRMVGLFQFSEPASLSISPEELTRFDVEDVETMDATHFYISQIHQIELNRQAESIRLSNPTLYR